MKSYGLSDRFFNLAGEYAQLIIGRISTQEKGLYRLVTEYGEKLEEVSGKFKYNAAVASDYPAVGDFVMVDWNENDGNAIYTNKIE